MALRSCPRCCTAYTSDVEHCALDGERLVLDLEDPMIGQVIDRYEVIECIGEGAMAAVYRARHQVIEREVACKVLFGEYAGDKQFAERFKREAQAASMVKHPNVVEVLDFGETDRGATFLLMELLDGHTLQDAINAQGAFLPRRAAWVVRDVAKGLAATHDAGLIHRDLKPGNIMLTADEDGRERAKILDFGVVQSFGDGKLTNTGQTLGTPYYMSPEQVGGNSELTPASDLYSLGVVVYEMLKGEAPFRGSFGEVLIKQVTERPERLPEAQGLEVLAERLLEKVAAARYQDAGSLITDLEALKLGDRVPFFGLKGNSGSNPVVVSNDKPTAAAQTARVARTTTRAPIKREAPAPSSQRSLIAAAGIIVALLVVASVIAFSGGDPEKTVEPTAQKRLISYEEEVRLALASRGLNDKDLEHVPEIAALHTAWHEAKSRGEGEEAVVTSLLSAIERAQISVDLLDKKRERIWRKKGNAPREIQEQVDRIPPDLEGLSSAERSQLAVELASLERVLSGK